MPHSGSLKFLNPSLSMHFITDLLTKNARGLVDKNFRESRKKLDHVLTPFFVVFLVRFM